MASRVAPLPAVPNPVRDHDCDELVRLARGGDLQAFNQLLADFQDEAYTLAYYLLCDGKSAEQVTQRAFVLAYSRLASFRKGSFRLWLLRQVAETCRTYFPAWLRGDGLMSIPPDQRLAVILVDVLGLDYAEAAEALEGKQSQVRRQTAAGRVGLSGAML